MAQINKSNEYFNTVLYTGNGSTQSITGINFKPDWTWIKNISADQNHSLTDIVRGVTKTLRTDVTTAETTDAQGQTSFDSDGFTVGSEAKINGSGNSIVSWNWLAGGTGVSNTQGTIASTVSASTTSGFSIVSYTGNGTAGATIGHGLGVTPAMFIIKNRSAAEHWVVYHQSISPSNMLYLNLTNAQDPANQFNSTAATANVFSVGGNIMVNATSNNYVAYCFAEKKGFSKFGSYTGNGIDTNGTFVYTGFKPAFIITKNLISTTAHWLMQTADGLNTYNPLRYGQLRANLSAAGITAYTTDFLSNGFKFYNDTNQANSAGEKFIYMAFAENPLVGTNNIPACAR